MANDIKNFIDQNHLQKAVLIGHSMCVLSSTLEALGEKKKDSDFWAINKSLTFLITPLN